jgi:hypothetical protein
MWNLLGLLGGLLPLNPYEAASARTTFRKMRISIGSEAGFRES